MLEMVDAWGLVSMKILYDFQIFSLQTFGGISRYFYELITNIEADQELRTELAIYLSNNEYLRQSHSIPHRPFLPNTKFSGKNIIIHNINKLLCTPRIDRRDYDIFHPTYFDPYFLSHIGERRFVLTVYDMIHERYEEIGSVEKKTSENKRLLAQKASKIIAISENTKLDIIRFFGVSEDKVVVVYLGNSISSKSLPGNPGFLPEKYILFVGARTFYKNFRQFLTSIVPTVTKDEGLYVLCAGGGAFTGDEIRLFRKLGIDRKVAYHSVNDDLLGHLYQNARVFVFPSLYEGFGIPVLEAFSCGSPTVLSNTGSLPEIAKDAALYFDPLDHVSIRQTVEKVLYDEAIRKDLIARGFERVKEFSWDRTARETRKVYESLL